MRRNTSKEKFSCQRGMTIVELLVAMTITVILMTLIFEFFITQSRNFAENRTSSEMQQELRWAMNYVSDHVKLAGNGVPSACGWDVVKNYDGGTKPDSITVLGSFRSLVIRTEQTMGNEGSQVKVNDTSGMDIGDLAVISNDSLGFHEIFMITGINSLHLWHDTSPPWNDDNKLDHRYLAGSSVTIVTYYSFFVGTDDEGRTSLMVRTQNYPAQPLLSDVEDFQIRFKLKDGSWVNETTQVYDIRMIEITIRSKSPEPIKDYTDETYGDSYKHLELKSVIIPRNIVAEVS